MRASSKKKNKGMTMVETLAAFTILIMLSLSFLAIIQFSSKMSMDADDRRALAQELDEKLALMTSAENGFVKRVSVGGMVLKSASDGTEYTLKNCEAYMMDHPVTDPEIRVLRFEYKE